jgi:tetratricopeptide (TPR) repeat protein
MFAARVAAEPIPSQAFAFERVGPAPPGHPTITNVQIVDLDGDGANEVIACDAQRQAVFAYQRSGPNQWRETLLGDGLVAPGHATVIDLEGDGDRDVVVSVMGNLYPDDEVIGSLVLLENDGGRYSKRVLLDDVRRVVDARPGDFDGDGDLDLAVAVFGYQRGQVLWLENRGDLQFRDHELLSAAGTIHVPVADYDGDGDLDIAAAVSQEDEEVWAFENLGGGEFSSRRLWNTVNFDAGTAGLVATDLDGDGDDDLLLPLGDNLEDSHAAPQPYHGCLWLENQGGWKFASKRLAEFPGTYAAAAGDLDADGDQDVVLASMVNHWEDPTAPSVVWLENDGKQNFKRRPIATDPIMLVTVACGDVSGDGRLDVVAGGLHVYPPFTRMGRTSSWLAVDASAESAAVKSVDVDASQPSLASPTATEPLVPELDVLEPLTRADLQKLRGGVTAKAAAGTATADDWFTLGQAYYAYGFFDAAERSFATALERNPKLFLASFFDAVSLARLGKLPAAIEQFERALPLAAESQKAWVWYEIGRTRLRQEDAEKAEAAFVAAGDHYAALAQLAKLRLATDRPAEAIAPINGLNRVQLGTIEAYVLSTRAAAATGQHEFAQQCRDHVEYNSKRFPLDIVQGMLLSVRGKVGSERLLAEARQLIARDAFAEAAPLLQRVVDAHTRADAVVLLAACELRLQHAEKAIALLESMQRDGGASPQAMQLLGDAYLAADQAKKAEAAWKDALQARSTPGLNGRLARLYKQRGDAALATRHRALEQQEIGIMALRSAELPSAQAALEETVKLDAALPRAWFYLGECRRLLGNAAGAREAYGNTLELAPNHGRAIDALRLVAE